MDVYRGRVVHCRWPHQMEVLEDHLVGVDTANRGKIMFVEPAHSLKELSKEYDLRVHEMSKSQFLMPGLIDAHIHAPQYKFTDTDHDIPLLEWLKTYAFPTEVRFSDVEVARKVYPRVVRRTLKYGTTTAAYFATIHLESSKELCRIIGGLGQRALVGKVNMDQDNDNMDQDCEYLEDIQHSVENTRTFIRFVQDMKNPLIQPMVTPRCAMTCSQALLNALGRLAQEMNVPVHSQIGEQMDAVMYTLEHNLMHGTCSGIFDAARMLTSKTCMSHCIYLGDGEIELFRNKHVGMVHCPNSNFSTQSGCLDVRKMMGFGIKVGLGTDVSRGYSPSILDAMRLALHTSKAVHFKNNLDKGYIPLSLHEALYLATLGGAQVLGLERVTGNFEVGKEFDALIIDTNAPQDDPLYDNSDTAEDCISNFLYHGDDRNIAKRFVAGQELVI